jgi:hypothetical protein
VYMASLALVCSFILFEVLDIDGSDFPTPVPRSVTAVKLADPPHDLKRIWTGPPSMVDGQIAPDLARYTGANATARLVTERPSTPMLAFRCPVLLARSSLDAPSA